MTQRKPADIVGSLAVAVKPWMGPMTLAALLILAEQVGQVGVTLGVPDFTIPLSRFEAAALFAGRIAALAIAILLTVFAAQGAVHRGWVKVQGLVAIAIAAGLLVALVVLWVDGPRVKTQVPADSIARFRAQWVRGLVVSLVGAFGFAVFGFRLLFAR
jgi:hypothetical protein